MSTVNPARGEVWMVDFDPVKGHEQGGRRPALVLSVDVFNSGPAELVIVLPITSKSKGVRSHVAVNPPEGGLTAKSFVKCEEVRSIAKQRFFRRRGSVSPQTMADVEYRLRILMGL